MSLLRSPRWIAGHVFALVGVVTFVSLGFWQLRRLDEVRDLNALISQRLDAPELPVDSVLRNAGEGPEGATYRRVSATGVYAADEEVLLSTRSHQGVPGHHLLTPLVLQDGSGLIVDRGWVPLELDEPPVAEATAGTDGEQVTVSGILLPPGRASSFGLRTSEEGEVDYVGRVDIARLQQQVTPDLWDIYLLAQGQEPPAPGALPVPGAPPELTEGSHLNYAGQWFLFASVVLVGYPFLLRRTLQDRRQTDEA